MLLSRREAGPLTERAARAAGSTWAPAALSTTRLALLSAALLLGPWMAPPRAHAQSPVTPPEASTREEALRVIREGKARGGQPYKPGKLEKWTAKLENERILEDWLSIGEGGRYYVKVGGLTTGGGLGIGPGVRFRRLANGAIDFDARVAVSYKLYVGSQASLTAPRLAGGRARVGVLARHKYYPQEDFFGLGPGSARANRVSYKYREMSFSGFGGRRFGPLDLEGRLEYLSPDVGAGKDTTIPSIEEIFTDDTAPGLAVQPDFLRAHVAADFNYATPFGNPRSGGRYLAAVSTFSDRSGGHYSFNRYEVDLRQYVPFLKDRRVLVFRALASFSDAPGDNEVPFYLQQTLGGSNTLRGFRDYRFRDRNLLLFQGEYRWEILPAWDAALFYDAGKVAPRISDLDLDDLQSDYGFGFRFGTNRGVFLRVDAGFGSRDGKRYFVKFGHVF